MAQYKHLPVFQDTYDLTLEIHKRVNNFPRVHRYSIGERIKIIGFDLLDLIIEANSAKIKTEFIDKAEKILEKLKIYARVCFDLKIMGNKGFEFMIRKMDEIGRQFNRWKEWSNANSSNQN
jgi:hypothetical protein